MPIYTEIQLYRNSQNSACMGCGPSLPAAFTKQNIGYSEAWAGVGEPVAWEAKEPVRGSSASMLHGGEEGQKGTDGGAPGQGPKVQQAREHAGLCPQLQESWKDRREASVRIIEHSSGN